VADLTEHLSVWARQRPQAPAVEFQQTTMTYAELDRGSSALAAALAAAGVGPGDRVGLWLRKSLESIVSVYGVLKAGAAYVPIDPSAPLARAARIIADCDLACIIANEDHVAWLVELADATGARWPVVSVGAEGAQATGVADGRVTGWRTALNSSAAVDVPPYRTDPSATAYILYTSGSEGVPKGVTISHANALAFVEWSVREFGMTTADRVSSHAPLHFDLSVLDVFAAGLAGACVVLIPESQVGMGGVLNKLVARRGVTVWYSVPNALTRMVTANENELLASSALRVVLFAGETFPVGSLRRLHRLVPGAALYNLYGPTETNVCTYHRVRESDVAPDRTEPVPIGRPCPYAEAFIVDAEGRELAQEPGVTGELCVSGRSVMRGYWRDATATAARTLRLRRDGAEPVQVYRTGDIVRLDAELNYVFCGREDDMVKIRGHRVELGEIESVLAVAANVREAVCVLVGDDAEERHIEAFVVPFSPPSDEQQLRRHCLTALPRYMVPKRFHTVAELPRTQSGKLDRRALLSV
jgi:amino acid adenylation domain-containing protein